MQYHVHLTHSYLCAKEMIYNHRHDSPILVFVGQLFFVERKINSVYASEGSSSASLLIFSAARFGVSSAVEVSRSLDAWLVAPKPQM